MQKNIIGILIAIILMLGLGFQSFRLKVSNEKLKASEMQIKANNEQNEKNIEDLQIRNQQIEVMNAEKNILQQKINKIRQSNSDKCFNSLLPNDVLQLLSDNDIK